jgi:DNA-binding IclR family transcriptional regulator
MREMSEKFIKGDGVAPYADDVLLCAALFIGQYEGRPMTAAKIAAYIGMPRPSAIRKLEGLMVRGIVTQSAAKHWVIASDKREIEARANIVVPAVCRRIAKATAELSKLDRH